MGAAVVPILTAVGTTVVGSLLAPKPKTPKVPDVPAAPTTVDPGVQQAAEEERRRQMMARGRASTILTGSEGLIEEPNLARRTLLPAD